MGKRKYNAKAREVVKTKIDNSQANEIKLEFANTEYGSSDTSNLLALPSKKRETKVVKEKKEKIRILSKQQRKRLEKIVEKKKKKENRAALLESLAQVQATPDEVRQLTGISAVQTIGLRKLNELGAEPVVQQQTETSNNKKFSSIAGAKKRLRLLKMESGDKKKKTKYDPNVVGLEETSGDEESSESDDDEPEVIENGDEDSINVKSSEKNNIDKSSKEDLANIENSSLTSKEKTVETNTGKDEKGTAISRDSNKTKVEPVKEVKEAKKPLLEHPTKHIEVKRDPKVQVARLKLPILGEEQRIMELINENEFLIVAGETGSGKTTQIPQFLYEAGYAEHQMIAVTEPRRVAAVAMSARVAHELALTSKEVSYLMRFEGNVTTDTKIKFMTDGVLLKEIQSDFLLSKYSVVIIDEAHERSVYTDILLGLLSRIVPLRRKRGSPLRLIIMSATLRVEDFTENTRLFKEPPPVIQIDSRQFPVTVHFNKHTYSDYLKEAYKKTVKIHTRLPDGGILIFVTGQQEVRYLVRKLKAAFPYRKDVDYSKLISKKTVADADAALDSEPDDIESDDDEVEKEMKRARKAHRKAKKKSKSLPKINLDDYDMPADDGQGELVDSDDSDGHLSDSDNEEDILAPEIKACRQPLWVLPLYSMLHSQKQARVFAPPPPGARLCVVSTDVAETSLTIPNVKYVVDTGKKKMKLYDHVTGASAWRVVWTSQASAGQRAGRAGRTAPGHAYRLYSSAVLQHDCPPHHPPDLCRRPVDDLLLLMKCMGIDKVVNFPFPTAPDRMQLRLAEKRLEVLGILEKPAVKSNRKDEEEILKVTALGKAVSAFPLLPRYGKMLALSHQQDLLPYTIALVSALTVPEVMSGKPVSWPATGNLLLLGDPGVLLRAVGAAEYAHLKGEEDSFCAKHGLREKAIKEIRKLRKQLTSEINLSVAGVAAHVDPEMTPPDDVQARLLRQLLLSGLGDQVARKIALEEVKQGEDKRKYKYVYHCGELDEPVHLHSDSILRKCIPEWVVYQQLYETGAEDRRKMVMSNVAAIEPEWLPVYVPQMCQLGEPLSDPEPRYDDRSGRVKCHFKGSFGKACWELPVVEIDYPDKVDRYKWFARFLLEGAVFPKLRKYTASLLSPPSTMVKSWAKLQPRTEILLKTLLMRRAGTRDALQELWTEQSNYLLDEYLKWIPESAHNEVTLNWPPL
ncbi:probable ATP-dependent RNA helicase kurz [Pectinophora gossypiella]|uniref:probable ATP-dependent RNA helicase kurz n=1 Tax=Pectinophora gossypiella TaxID=13191 RepID=UPI00214F5D25|nr:probable ATP-dependent RNA helicase kurz [Pectinophora gossypiella]